MTPRERFMAALDRKPLTGRIPHFELSFYLTMEAFGKVHPQHRDYRLSWNQMEEKERQLHLADIAEVYLAIAQRYEHSAILIELLPMKNLEAHLRVAELIRERSGDRYFLMIGNDPTPSIPSGEKMVDFAYQLADEPEKIKASVGAATDRLLEVAAKCREHGAIDGFAMCSDYCYNSGPFMSPNQFGEFVTPYLERSIAGYRDMGFYVIKHTDGNIMPILDQLVQAHPHALHSIDPQGGVDIARVKALVGDKVCLIGNVNCGLLDTGTDEQCIESARYCLRHGMPGGGYVFSTSNCVYSGMRLERYELIHRIWREEGQTPARACAESGG